MKKMITILSALAVLVCGLTMSSCDDEVADILAPANQWKIYPVTKQDGKREAYIAMYYTETTKTEGAITMEPGLNCLVWPDGNVAFMGLKMNTYVLKTFAKDEDLTFDDNDPETSSEIIKIIAELGKMNRTSWGVIYNTTKSKYIGGTPAPIAAGTSGSVGGVTYIPAAWDEIKSQFSWKRIVANYLLAGL